MKFIFASIMMLASDSLFAQNVDTIYTYALPIPANVLEVGVTDVSYTLPNEKVTYRALKNSILSISFANGRKEIFNTRLSLDPVQTFADWEKVVITSIPQETEGLIRIDMASTKATGATTLSSVTNTQNRAFKKMKQAAALLGGSLVYLDNQSVEGNIYGARTTRTQLTGSVFRSAPFDTTGISTNISGRRFIAKKKTVLGVNNAEAVEEFMQEPPIFRMGNYQPIDYRNGLLYMTLNLGQPVTEFLVVEHQPGKLTLAYAYRSRYVQMAFVAIRP